MMKAIALLLSLCLGLAATQQNAIAADDGVPIFNGKDLAGWKVHGTEKWFVENGELVCESGPDAAYGYLATEKQYRDFELTIDFKQSADGNSGIFFRSSLDGTKISGWQVEVAPPNNNSGGVYESYGRGWLIKPDAEAQKALKFGEWNTMKIRVVGGHVTTWLNGTQMIDLKMRRSARRMDRSLFRYIRVAASK
jgi:hypothetical protein